MPKWLVAQLLRQLSVLYPSTDHKRIVSLSHLIVYCELPQYNFSGKRKKRLQFLGLFFHEFHMTKNVIPFC